MRCRCHNDFLQDLRPRSEVAQAWLTCNNGFIFAISLAGGVPLHQDSVRARLMWARVAQAELIFRPDGSVATMV